jgi:hypothetical protein
MLGSSLENIRDAKAKGRMPWQQKDWSRRHLVGERNHNTKLTDQDVRDIRCAYAGGETQTSIATRYPVTQTVVSDIVRRKSWRHITAG